MWNLISIDLCVVHPDAEIWALRELEEKEEEKEEEKISHMCESIGHWPLQGHSPKGGMTDMTIGIDWKKHKCM